MNNVQLYYYRLLQFLLLGYVVFFSTVQIAFSAELIMQDGRHLHGKLGTLRSIGEEIVLDPHAVVEIETIVFLDDDLRRTYVPRFRISNVNQDDPLDVSVKFLLPQKVRQSSPVIANVGALSKKQPFDPFGRRIVTMNTARGPVDIIQGITELTPEYVKVQGISHCWDMRISTGNIPSSVLDAILQKQVRPGDVEGVKKIARFYIQARQYKDAVRVITAALAQPNLDPKAKEDLESVFQSVKQMAARLLLEELETREKSGQYKLVEQALNKFPVEGVSSEILQQVRRKLQDFNQFEQQKQNLIDQLKVCYTNLPNNEQKKQIAVAVRELYLNLSRNTIERLASFEQSLDDKSFKPEDRLSLALSGWLLGAENATQNMAVSLSAFRVRGLIEQYMATPDEAERKAILKRFKPEEASAIPTVAHILANMQPPEPVDANSRITEEYFNMNCKNVFDKSDTEYLVQLPPEYDPYKKYPVIISLHGEFTTPQMQLDWWCGSLNEKGTRNGQAGRQGYIVIAPEWTNPAARQYDYSGSSHGAVLGCLQDACRHFSIDSDRVFLSGYSMGASAAWDIAVAHPDLWAGVIPIAPKAEKYLAFCGFNAQYVPTYFVFGQFDSNLMTANASLLLNRYMAKAFDMTIVEYLGRGHEDFQDEILRLMDWMNRKKRNFYPEKFECKSMRTFDTFFWNLEQFNLPSKKIADPANWPPARGTTAAVVSCDIRGKASLSIKSLASDITIWLNPNIVDFDKKLVFLINTQRLTKASVNNQPEEKLSTGFIEPSLEVMLEDVRTRGDRQNPFWAKVVVTQKRRK